MAKKISDDQLEQQIKIANERLDKLQKQKEERQQARRNQLARYLEEHYDVTTIQELESLLHHPQNTSY